MRCAAVLACVLAVALVCVVNAQKRPLTETEVPAGWAEPQYSNNPNPMATLVEVGTRANKLDTVKGTSSSASSSSQVSQTSGSSGGGTDEGELHMTLNGQKVSMYPAAVIPGPWLGSFSARMDGMGIGVPPYAFDPANYARLGGYRALTNKYSDGTSYPLNMQKYDFFPYTNGGSYVGQGTAEYSAPLFIQEEEEFEEDPEEEENF